MTSDPSNYHREYSPYGSYSLFQFEGSDVLSVLKNSIEYSFVFFKVPVRVQQFFCFWKLFVALNNCANFFGVLTLERFYWTSKLLISSCFGD